MVTCTRTPTFLDEITSTAGGENIMLCMQCGACTGSCPTANKMDYTPAELIAMIQAGLKDEVLSAKAPWYCLSCYSCTARCPRGVKITNLMHAILRLSMKYNKADRTSVTPKLYRTFTENVYNKGRITELKMMIRFFLRTNPFKAVKLTRVGIDLLSHRRISMANPKLSKASMAQIQLILDKAANLGP
jgi:heterodisulfide reductase subunit C